MRKDRIATFALVVGVVSVPAWAGPGEMNRRLYPEDLVYQGAFRFPQTEGDASRWSYGGSSLAYNPSGDSGGSDDGYPGSLFSVGHAHHQLVAEISIPKPVISPEKETRALPVAKQLQPFADITGGLIKAALPDIHPRIVGGLSFLEPQLGQKTPKIYWTIFLYYNVTATDFLSHGWSELNLLQPNAQGVWHLGPRNSGNPQWNSMKHNGYLFDVPRAWADRNLKGQYLVSGHQVGTGCGNYNSSAGPALFAFAPWQYPSANPPPYGAELEATPLLWYRCEDGPRIDHEPCDEWSGGAWIEQENKAAVLIVGRKSLGERRYGLPAPGDCETAKGWHCDPYEPQILFYDPEELALAARGLKKPWEISPYARMTPKGHLWPTCHWRLPGAALDRQRGLLYIVQYAADGTVSVYEKYPLVHVFKISPKSRSLGDVNGDRELDLSDAIFLLKVIVGREAPPEPSSPSFQAADVNRDGRLNLVDVICLLQHLFRDRPLPCG